MANRTFKDPSGRETETVIYNGTTEPITYGTQLQLNNDLTKYNRLVIITYSGSIEWRTRGVVDISTIAFQKSGTMSVPVYFGTTLGYLQLSFLDDHTKIEITDGSPTTFYITFVYGIL